MPAAKQTVEQPEDPWELTSFLVVNWFFEGLTEEGGRMNRGWTVGYHAIPHTDKWTDRENPEIHDQIKVPIFSSVQLDPHNELNRVYDIQWST